MDAITTTSGALAVSLGFKEGPLDTEGKAMVKKFIVSKAKLYLLGGAGVLLLVVQKFQLTTNAAQIPGSNSTTNATGSQQNYL